MLYDWTRPILEADVPIGMSRLQGLLWAACIVLPIATTVWVLSALMTWFAPDAEISRYVQGHYWSIVIVLAVLFFFYLFFRLVWDGLSEPTIEAVAHDNGEEDS